MTYDELIAHFKTQRAAADAIGISQPSVADWKDKGIPEPRQAQYQLITGGKLLADLPEPAKARAARKPRLTCRAHFTLSSPLVCARR